MRWLRAVTLIGARGGGAQPHKKSRVAHTATDSVRRASHVSTPNFECDVTRRFVRPCVCPCVRHVLCVNGLRGRGTRTMARVLK
eukprot:6136788-Prymnesium_polylepis.1